ncbi:MAG: serine/threonine protein kinase [Comamonadaceae bacterium]|nr:MAG: serine/threonine protein kinase [Comamonadaceae bacterium]
MARKFEADEVCAALGVSTAEYRGTGSFGETWRADFDGHDAAYKIIHNTGDDAERLRREVEGYRRIDNAHVVKFFDVRTFHVAGVDRPVMIFEYIPGCDLSELIKVQRPTPEELRGLARGLLTGVLALHGADLLHRDLKPANIALRDGKYDGAVILDLGLAKLLDVESITRYPTLLGTTFYMAPEQLRQEKALRASDLWAIGEMLFEAATGSHPFFRQGEALGLPDALARLSTPPVLPSDLPADIADLILRCLSEVPHRRGTVAKALSRLA